MDNSIIVAVVSIIGTIISASITFYLTKKRELKIQWQNEKLNHYKVLLSSLSDLAVDGIDKDKANERFVLAVNTIAVVAPQYVITALMNFYNEAKFSNKSPSIESYDLLFKELILAIRKDIGLSIKDDIDTFNFHLIGAAPRKRDTYRTRE